MLKSPLAALLAAGLLLTAGAGSARAYDLTPDQNEVTPQAECTTQDAQGGELEDALTGNLDPDTGTTATDVQDTQCETDQPDTEKDGPPDTEKDGPDEQGTKATTPATETTVATNDDEKGDD